MRIILLPGLDGTGDLFEEFVRFTPPSFEPQVVTYPYSEPLTYPQCSDFAKDLLPKGEPFLLLGESFSGPVAISVAAQSPPGLRGLILCNTFACRPAWSVFRFLPWRLAFSVPMPRYKVGLYLVGFKNVAGWEAPIRQANRKVLPEVHAARMREVLTVDVRSDLCSVSVPTLYVRGSNDRLVWKRSLTKIVKARASVSVAEIEAPHMALQLAPKECWSAILDFVNLRCT